MKKKLLGSLLSIAMIAVVAMSVAACGAEKTKTATAYGIVHGHYLGIATVTVGAKGKIVDANLDEAMFPYSWAAVKLGETITAEDVLVIEGNHGPFNLAKYIQIGDKYFKTSVDGKKDSYKEVDNKGADKANGITDLYAKLDTDADTAKWYVETLLKQPGNVVTLKLVDGEFVEMTKGIEVNNGFFKSTNNYWTNSEDNVEKNYKKGFKQWTVNADATVAYVIEKGIPSEDEIQAHKDAKGKPADLVTGATWTDYADYLSVLRKAYELAK